VGWLLDAGVLSMVGGRDVRMGAVGRGSDGVLLLDAVLMGAVVVFLLDLERVWVRCYWTRCWIDGCTSPVEGKSSKVWRRRYRGII
jgi:hypothetical protein